MSWQYHPLIIVLQLGGLISLGVAAYCVRYTQRHGTSYLVASVGVMAVNNAIWVFAAAGKMATTDLAASMLWYRLEYFGYALNPGVAVIVALAYTNRNRWLTRRTVAMFTVVPVAILGLALWNPSELVFVDPYFISVGQFQAFEHGFGPLYPLVAVWAFGASFLSVLVLVHDSVTRRLPRLTSALLIVTFSSPVVFAVFKNAMIYPPGGTGVNVSPAAASLAFGIMAVTLVKHRLFDLHPVGRQRATDVMAEGYVLLNETNEIVDTNPAARQLLMGDEAATLAPHSASEYIPVVDELGDRGGSTTFTSGERVIQVRCSAITRQDETVGRVLLLLDITDRRERERELERKERIIENVPVGVYRNTPGPEGEILYMNETLIEMAGADSKAELHEYSVSDLYVDSDERAAFSEKLLKQGSVSNEELLLRTVDGEKRWMLVSNARVEEDGQTYFEGAIQDITERKEYQQQLEQQRDKLKDQKQQLERQRNELENQKQQLERTQEQVQLERDGKEAIRHLLLQTSTDQELATSVCQLLVETYDYTCVWFVRSYDSTDDESDVVTIADYGDDRGFRADDGDGELDPVTRRALAAGETVEVTANGPENIAQLIESSGLYTVRAIPLVHNGITYGALTVLRSEPETDYGRELVDEFAGAMAFKRRISRQQEALVTDTIIEIDIRLTDSDHFLVVLSTFEEVPAGATLYAHELRSDDDLVTYLLKTDDVSPAILETAASDVETVRDTTILVEENSDPVVQLQVDPPTLGSVLGSYGGMIQSIIANDGQVDLTVQFPRRTDVGDVVESVREHWSDIMMRSRSEQTIEEKGPAVFESLTDKQEEALRAAALAGFFDRPQQTTASEVAETLGVSRSTFLHHLRNAEQKVFKTAFEDGTDT